MDVKKQHWFNMEQKGAVLISLFVLFVLSNSAGLINWTIPCFFEHFLSIECFGCGTTKAIELAFVGKLGASISENPLGLATLFYVFLKFLHLIYSKLYQI